jgi:hypothetical protein
MPTRNIISLDGYTFDSPEEAARYEQLKNMEINGLITLLTVKPKFLLTDKIVHPSLSNIYKNGHIPAMTFIPDFSYMDSGGLTVYEDVKGKITSKNRIHVLKPDWMNKLKFFLTQLKQNCSNARFEIFWHEKYTAKQKKADLERWSNKLP